MADDVDDKSINVCLSGSNLKMLVRCSYIYTTLSAVRGTTKITVSSNEV